MLTETRTTAPTTLKLVNQPPQGRFYLTAGLLAAAWLVAASTGLPLTWDGSYVLFRTLDRQAPFISNNRWIDLLLDGPALLVSQFTGDLPTLRFVFSLTYAAMPLLALGLAWLVVRKHQPGLFIWALLGIGLGTLPGQVVFISEGLIAVQLGWVLWLGALSGLRRPYWPLVVAAILIFFAHPVAILVFGLAGGLALLKSLRDREQRKTLLMGAGIFGVLTVAAGLNFVLNGTNYEDQELAPAVLSYQFGAAVWGLPLLAVVAAWLVGLAFAGREWRANKPRWNLIPVVVQWVTLVAAGGLLFFWAQDTHLWYDALDFRTWAFPVMLPFVGLASWEALRRTPRALQDNRRTNLAMGIAVVFLLVLTVQGVAWSNLGQRLRETVQAAPQRCVTTHELAWTNRTPLDHWTLTAYSLLTDNNQPQPAKIVLPAAGCAQPTLSQQLPITNWDVRGVNNGWFQLQPLATALQNEQSQPVGCRTFLNEGWYNREGQDGNWWRWSSNTGKLAIFSDRPATIQLNFALRVAQSPNTVKVTLNGQPQTSLNVNWSDIRSVEPLTIGLKPGQNLIEFTSANPAVKLPDDSRDLAFVLSNLSLSESGAPVCPLQN